ncbi:general transcription factor 3C polypeptide 3 [Anopheles bellator]|uniref:general transcription factor 3C polypeptide 3 n=1 Tax=Anopheles bellator TaxID=139047 RepID=UPI0026472474|nr:general transcription factor 3C polypeptide 3 [Anopheles bellator]
MSESEAGFAASDVEIEEVDVYEMDEDVLKEFIEVHDLPRTVSALPAPKAGPSSATVGTGSSAASESETDEENTEQRETLIKKLVAREISYNEYQERMQQDDDLDDEDVEMDRNRHRKSFGFEADFRTARRDALKGNLQGPTHPASEGKNPRRRQRRLLPPALQGLMGEANLCYARGDTKTAKDLCLEIIRQVPLAYEPFITLAQIYEADDPEQYLECSLIAAHLNPSDIEHWVRVAEISIERGNIEQAQKCYTRAIKADPKNIDVRLKRAQLVESKGDEKQACKYYYDLLPHVPKEQGDFLISTAKRVAKKFHEETNIGAALEAMDRAYATVPEKFSSEDINLLLELLIANGLYQRALDVLATHANVAVNDSFSPATEADAGQRITFSVSIPDEMILDLRTKLAMVLVHLKCEHLFTFIIDDIMAHIDPENGGDCYLDIAEALMKEEYYRYALRLLVPLIKSNRFSMAAVWLRYADCSRFVEKYDEAIEGYRRVVSLAQHLDARLALAALLKKQGKYTDALKALEQDPEREYLDPEVLHERCLMLEEIGYYKEFLEAGFMLLARNCYQLKNRHEMELVVSYVRFYDMRANETEKRVLGEGVPDFVSGSDLQLETEWDLVLRLLRVAEKMRNYPYFMKLVFTLNTSKRFQGYRYELLQLALAACIFNRDPTFGHNILREQIRTLLALQPENINHPRLWNVFNLVVFISGDVRYNRYLARLFDRVPSIAVQPKALIANYHLTSCTYKYALNEYNKIFRATEDPLYAMMVAVTLTQIACQKFTPKKQTLVAQANIHMDQYRKGRMAEIRHEVYYNFGRMFHQLGMLHLAVDYYKRVLSFDSAVIRECPEHLDLKAETAYNLSCIYKQSGNLELARKYLYEYIRV